LQSAQKLKTDSKLLLQTFAGLKAFATFATFAVKDFFYHKRDKRY
jgi:hypothetical protein